VAQVKEACRKWLLKTYGDVHGAITDPEMRQSFCGLHLSAVKLWMEADELAATENDVAVLVTFWHAGKQVNTLVIVLSKERASVSATSTTGWCPVS